MPILYSLKQNKENLYFLDVDKETDLEKSNNITTIITGKNSVGKSRLLRSITIDCLKNDLFEKVIAISNTQYHKFPSYKEISTDIFKNEKYVRLAFDIYPLPNRPGINSKITNESIDTYLQNFLINNNLRVLPSRNSGNLNILKCLEYFVIKSSKNIRSSKNIKSFWVLDEILKFLGLDKYLKFDIYRLYKQISNHNEIFNIIEESINLNKNLNEEQLFYLIKLRDSLENIKNIGSFSLFDINEYQLESLGLLINLGLVKIRRAHFSKEKEILAYSDLSSGELAVLSLILGLSSELENNSIICIDEPELNLHPEWQEKIIQLIELVANFYYGCHFFIATHSPQLVSGVTNNNTFVLDLSKNRVFNISNYKNRSSDFQLSEIFNFPGNNNEYLIRKLLIILNKQNTEDDYQLDFDSKKILSNIRSMIKQEKFHDQDKVKILFELISDF